MDTRTLADWRSKRVAESRPEDVRRLDVGRHAEIHDAWLIARRASSAAARRDGLALLSDHAFAVDGELDLALHHHERLAAKVVVM